MATDWREVIRDLEATLADENRGDLDKVMDSERVVLLAKARRLVNNMTPCEYCKEKGCEGECFW